MTCAELEDRFFDEDCRLALLGRGEAPRDVTEHLALCSACALAWERAAARASRLSRGLVTELSPTLRDRLYLAFRTVAAERGRGATIGTGTEILSSVIAFGALGAALASGEPRLSQWTGFALGAGLALAAASLRRTRWIWRVPVAELLKVLRRCLDQLVPSLLGC